MMTGKSARDAPHASMWRYESLEVPREVWRRAMKTCEAGFLQEFIPGRHSRLALKRLHS